MVDYTVKPMPLTSQAFAEFGDVIEKDPDRRVAMNSGTFDRFQNLAGVDLCGDCKDSFVNVSIARCRTASELPYRVELMERHPLGSQAFFPISMQKFIIVVAPAGETVDAAKIQAFFSNGEQGINMRRGIWHIPLISLKSGEEFLVIDRGGSDNYDEIRISEKVIVTPN